MSLRERFETVLEAGRAQHQESEAKRRQASVVITQARAAVERAARQVPGLKPAAIELRRLEKVARQR